MRQLIGCSSLCAVHRQSPSASPACHAIFTLPAAPAPPPFCLAGQVQEADIIFLSSMAPIRTAVHPLTPPQPLTVTHLHPAYYSFHTIRPGAGCWHHLPVLHGHVHCPQMHCCASSFPPEPTRSGSSESHALHLPPTSLGQVQDVGIIFLSSMATSIAATCAKASLGVDVALGTTLLTFSIATFLVGLLTLLVGEQQ